MSERGQTDVNPGGQREDALRAAAVRLSLRQGRRAAAAVRELADPFPLRLSDRQRAAIESLSGQLFQEIEDELRAAILADDACDTDDALEASLGSAHVAIAAPILEAGGLLPDAEVVALALDRAEQHEAGRRLREEGASGDRLAAMVGDGAASDAAMALLIAESRANLRFDDPKLPLADVPAELRERLVWQVAAALRHYAVAHHGANTGFMDALVARAAEELLVTIAKDSGLMDAARTFADAFATIDADILRDTLGEGRAILYCAILGRECDVAMSDAWSLVSDLEGVGHALLLRAARIDREAGAPLVSAMLDAMGSEAPGQDGEQDWLDVWKVDADIAAAALGNWRHPRAYREALARFAGPGDVR